MKSKTLIFGYILLLSYVFILMLSFLFIFFTTVKLTKGGDCNSCEVWESYIFKPPYKSCPSAVCVVKTKVYYPEFILLGGIIIIALALFRFFKIRKKMRAEMTELSPKFIILETIIVLLFGVLYLIMMGFRVILMYYPLPI